MEYVLFLGGFVLVSVAAVGGLNGSARTYFSQAGSRIGQPTNNIVYDANGNRQGLASTTSITAPPSTAAPTTTTSTTSTTTTTAAPTTTRATTTTAAAPTTTRATTTTTRATTTTSTTTTTTPPSPSCATPVASTSAAFNWWNGNQTNGNGAWVASYTIQNTYNRGKTIDLQISKVHSNGTTANSTASHYVGANSSSTFQVWDNTLSASSGVRTGITSVRITVTKVTTADANWNTITCGANGTSSTVSAP